MRDTFPNRMQRQFQFLRFAGVGVFATTAHYALLLMLFELAHINAVLALTAGASAGALVSYALNRRYTSTSSSRHRAARPKFTAVAGSGLTLNPLCMAMLVETLELHYMASQILTTGIVFFRNPVGNKLWTFRS